MAATTAGLAWPRLAEPCPPTQSMYSRPSASHSCAPSPRTIAIGRLGYTPLVWAASAAIIASVDAYDIIASSTLYELPCRLLSGRLGGSQTLRNSAYITKH